jgi:hypothetical protein
VCVAHAACAAPRSSSEIVLKADLQHLTLLTWAYKQARPHATEGLPPPWQGQDTCPEGAGRLGWRAGREGGTRTTMRLARCGCCPLTITFPFYSTHTHTHTHTRAHKHNTQTHTIPTPTPTPHQDGPKRLPGWLCAGTFRGNKSASHSLSSPPKDKCLCPDHEHLFSCF